MAKNVLMIFFIEHKNLFLCSEKDKCISYLIFKLNKIKFMHLADAFIQSVLQCIQADNLHLSCVPGESNTKPCAS